MTGARAVITATRLGVVGALADERATAEAVAASWRSTEWAPRHC